MTEECIHSPLEVEGRASDGWNQHNNKKSTECTHGVMYMCECGGGSGDGGVESGVGGHLLTFFFSFFFFDVGSHHPLSRNCSEIFLHFFSALPKQRSQHERNATCRHHSHADMFSQDLSPRKLRIIFSLARISLIALNGVFASC